MPNNASAAASRILPIPGRTSSTAAAASAISSNPDVQGLGDRGEASSFGPFTVRTAKIGNPARR